jgi:polysaccharide biosynthesis transport protein
MEQQMTATSPMQYEEQLFDLREVLRVINHYKWGILGVTVVTTLAAILWAFSLTPIYRSSATLLIEPKSNQPIRQVDEVYDPGFGRNDYYGTQIQILKSRELARRVVERMDLVNHEEFKPEPPSWPRSWIKPLRALLNWRNWLPFMPEAPVVTLSESELEDLRKEQVVADFGKRLLVQYVPVSQLVTVSFEARHPELSAEVANALADVYIESALEGRLSMTQKASGWLTERLASIKEDLQRSEQALQAFREQEQLVNVGGQRGMVEGELTDTAQRLRDAKRVRAELASTYSRIQQAGNDPRKLEDVSALLQDEVVSTAKINALQAQENVKQIEQRYGPKHPQMIAARARLDGATAAYHNELITAAMGVRAKYEVARENERVLGQFEASARGTIRGLDRKQYQLRALERDVESNRQLYDMFLARFKETDVSGGYEALIARVIDPAIVPRIPVKPNKRKIALVSAFLGLLLGLLLAALRATLSDMVRSGEELESLTGTPVLGVLPLLSPGDRKDLSQKMIHSPKSGFAEGIRSIRTGILLSDIDKKRKRLVVTSSVPEEGKTTLAINLAMAHGQIEKVLLLEGDLRRPSIAARCGIKDKSAGLVDWLSGSAPLENCIYRHEAANIDILHVGKVPPNPAEIFASGRFLSLIEALAERYDRVIIDSAPCHAVSDTVMLAQNCDGLIFLVQADVTSKRMIRSAVKHLRHARIPIVGAVVNQIDLKRHGHYYASYYTEYGYYT